MSPNTLSDFWFALEQVAQPLWFWIVQGAVFTTATALLIIVFKLIFKNRISAKWHFLVWAILLIRLVFPVLPSTPVSIFNFAKMDEQSVTSSSVVNIVSQEGYYRQNDEPRYSLTFGENAVPDNNKPDSDGVYYNTNVHAFRFGEFFAMIWAAGALVLSVYFIIVLIIYRRGLKKKRHECDEKTLSVFNFCKERLGIKRSVRLYFADTTPVLTGLFRPSIHIPDSYSEHELEAVLIHELCHLKHLDVLWSGVAAAVLCLNWYNPVIWVSFFMFKRDIELYCDERTLKFTGNRQRYAKLLLKTATKNRYVLGTSSLQSGKSDVKRRIKFLAKYKKITAVAVIAVILAAAISVICLTNAMDKNYRPGKSDEINPNISYDYNWATDTLDIYGEGDMNEYETSNPPWQSTESTKKIIVHNGITSLCSDAFSADIDGNTGKPRNGLQDTTNIELPDSLTKIGDFAFLNCISLTEIKLPKNLTDIGDASFRLCKSLKSIELPDSVTVISHDLFSECEALESVKLGKNTKIIGNLAFSGTRLKEIDIPDTVTKIGVMAFSGCDFTTVTIPQSVTFIDDRALGYNDNGEKTELTIRGYEGSAAEKYADINGFKFEAIGQTEINSETFRKISNIQISDYYIETDSQVPLKTAKINDINDAISIINTMGQLDPDFTLYDLSQMDKNLYFRKTASDKLPYYCIVEGTESHDKAFLFFKKPDGYWICRDYIALFEDGSPYIIRNFHVEPVADGENALLNLIAKVDR